MNLTLQRFYKGQDGIFSDLIDPSGLKQFVCLEHAYPLNESFAAKIPPGEYRCVRGQHKLHNAALFGTYEVTGVSGHSGLLFHIGNFNRDSDGCILVGGGFQKLSGGLSLVNSKLAFDRFIGLQRGLPEFQLTVVEQKDMGPA